ncbi:MAG TPA: FG-GAP repeat protein, partial [Candidatus Polarisedimenticolia bacterium]|nr:FG-GAP repeat protein [Candidatus Polarisedimenticolia bacterium]
MNLVATALAVAAAAATIQVEPILSIDMKRPAIQGLSLAVVQGAEPLAWAGASLAGGDINGDGIADLVIGAPGGSDDRPSRRGRIYVLYGGVARPRATVDLALRRRPSVNEPGKSVVASEADVIIEGRDDFDHLGAALAVADTDGDGFADIVAGAPRADGPGNARPDCGEVVILHGATNLPPLIDLKMLEPGALPPAPRLRLVVGRSAGDVFGSALVAGDVNADGLIDLVVGAPLADQTPGTMTALDAGECYLLPGTREPRAVVDLGDASAVAPVTVLRGADPADQ